MKKIPPIRVPLWNIKRHGLSLGRGLGIAKYHFESGEDILVECSYKDKDKRRMYPHPYLIKNETHKRCRTQLWKGVELVCIPFVLMDIIEPEENKKEGNNEESR